MFIKLTSSLVLMMSLVSCGRGLGDDPAPGAGGGTGGASYKRINLVSSTMPTGDFGFSHFDSACSAGYKALAASTTRYPDTGSGELDWVLEPNTQYRRMDGTTVIGTTNNNAVFTFPLTNSFGAAAGKFYTGFNSDWTYDDASTCFDWSSMIDDRIYGDALSTSSNAINDGVWNCGTSGPSNYVVCVEQ